MITVFIESITFSASKQDKQNLHSLNKNGVGVVMDKLCFDLLSIILKAYLLEAVVSC